MKKIIFTLAVLLIGFSGLQLKAQSPPPPPPNHGSTGNTNGGNAPVGSGLAILISLGTAYGIRKLYIHRKETLEE